MTGRITHIFLKTAHRAPLQAVDSAAAEAGLGLAGDLNYGVRKRQILLIDDQTLGEFGLEPGQIRENVVVSGLDLAGLAEGAQLRAGEALLEVTGDCDPCQFIDAIRPGLEAAMRGRRGIFGRVVQGGLIRLGDPVEALAVTERQP
ncbi:MAG: MOSC domain-containing protein [Candidatus Promineifilaceae bacterium]